MARRVTMAAVAERAGVSPMTVSNVLRGKPSVSASMRERVMSAVAETGYRLNPSASALRSGRSGVIGLLVPGIDAPYFGLLGQLLTRAARARGLSVAIEAVEAEASAEAAAVERARRLDVDGVIITPLARGPEDWSGLLGALPTVFLGERPAPAGATHIELPNRDGTRAATTHLISRGARRLAFVGGALTGDHLTVSAPADGAPTDDARPEDPEGSEGDDVTSRRAAGYAQALRDAGLPVDPALLLPAPAMSQRAGRDAVLAAHERGIRPDGFVAVTDTVALGVLRGLADLGVRVPHDASVVGFDGIDEGEFSVPSLTTVAPDHGWVVERALTLLMAQVEADDDQRPDPVQISAPFTLLERESTRA